VYRVLFLLLLAASASPQTELAPWGNIRGIRISGQLMPFETGLRVVQDGREFFSGKEMQRPRYERRGDTQVVTTTIHDVPFTKKVWENGTGAASLLVEAGAPAASGTLFFTLDIPQASFPSAGLQLDGGKTTPLSAAPQGKCSVSRLRFVSAPQQLEVRFPEPTEVSLRRYAYRGDTGWRFYIPLAGTPARKTAEFKITGNVDTQPVRLSMNPAQPGRVYEGFGGNFRLQNPKTDPQVINYSLANLRLAWSRVEMPWRFWQPQLADRPMDSARAGRLHPAVKGAMEMAQRLYRMGIPVIVSAWSGPAWAVVGTPRFQPDSNGVWGNPLNEAQMPAIYRSIGDYLATLKEVYGVETALFSFNESDLGINIRQTGEEHAQLIRGLGAYLESRGLKTKMLLGDNSDANSYSFIYPAMNDPRTHPYIGALSFHSWRGWDKETLQKWADAATQLQRPLLVGEGSIDAQAWGYPAIFEEPTYALEEINLYTRLINICQPASILQWQLTADYSPMVGGGIFGNNGPLRPTQRFWNLKQLANTPANLRALPATSSRTDVSVAALGDTSRGIYTVHLVNNGAAREARLEGLPAGIRKLRVWVTDKNRPVQEMPAVTVRNGTARFRLDARAYTTVSTQ
jgi:hypothetical protein